MVERVLISLEDVTLTFGGKPLFEGITLHISEGDKICLVGRNGAGKTTLMRLIMEELELDGGKRYIYPGTKIGYLAQKIEFNPKHTVREYVLSGFGPKEQTEDKQYLADIVMSPLTLNPDALMPTLSGGQLRRASLAKALISEPDILLLDEPTNHLDLNAIEWLEGYINSYKGAIVCVSHDRAFLNNISRKVFWIDRGVIRTSGKGYAQFEEWAASMLEQEAREIHNMQKKLEIEEGWTQGGITARRKRNMRRMRDLYKLREKLKTDKAAYNQTIRTIELDPVEPAQASKIICEFKNVTKVFEQGEKKVPILKNFNLRVMRGDRIGILGKNGSGKSTFLKLLTDELEPDSGRVSRGKTVDISYFDQNRVNLNPDKTIWKTLCPEGGDYIYLGKGENKKPRHVCGYLRDFLFDPKIARDLVGTLSGGQQNRLLLAKMLSNPGNVLILDEPTNDLDMDTLDMLQEILSDYSGTLLIVSHDRDFLDRTVTKILAFEGDATVEGYMGGYSDYLVEKQKRHGITPTNKKQTSRIQENQATQKAEPTQKKLPKLSFSMKHELEKLPAKMEKLEKEIAPLKEILADSELYTKNPDKFDSTMKQFAKLQKQLEEAESKWIELEELRLQDEQN